uniref:NADH:ubiquinone reductase (H(+)-translocating) n=1 Tax=Podocoryna carnea TaxID=6096 RepID=A0A0S4LZ52_PODCA|nr:TPA: NADH dehydrogenase subunit 2 [Podocoryna carnea]
MEYLNFILVLLLLFILFLELNKAIRKNSFLFFLTLSLIYFISLNFKSWHLHFMLLDFWRMSVILLILIIFIVLLTLIKDLRFEVLFLNLMILLGAIMLILCDHLILVYLLLELQTFSSFILISKNKNSIKGSEAGLKYFILGALSSGLFLLGLSFLFSSSISMSIGDLLVICSFELYSVKIGIILIFLSLFFKLAIFPLHFWIADIYEGSSWEVLSIISTIPKISVLYILSQFTMFSDFIMFSSLLSIIIGTVGAFNQTKLKRLLAYSGISHMGFILLGFSVVNKLGYEASFIYLIIYMFSILSIFLLVSYKNFGLNNYLIELGNLNIFNKTLSVSWLIAFLSIAGIPPFAGFISKWFMLSSMINFNFIVASLIGIIFSAIGAGYYLRVVKIIYFQKKGSYFFWDTIINSNYNNNIIQSYVLGILVYSMVFIIVQPNFLLSLSNLSFNYFV